MGHLWGVRERRLEFVLRVGGIQGHDHGANLPRRELPDEELRTVGKHERDTIANMAADLGDKSADAVWQWISNVRNIMTANQFHVAAECSEADARNPRGGLEVPIEHGILSRKNYRMARIAKFEDYAISSGERLLSQDREDPFPHSERWRVEAIGPNRCSIQNHARFRFMARQFGYKAH